MTIRIVLVEQLACQVVQYVSYFILSLCGIAICKAGGNAFIICNKGDSRAFCCIGNMEAAANHLGRIISIILIEYSGMTAVIDNRNRIIVLLINQACIIGILTALQRCQRAAFPYRIFVRYGRCCHVRLLLIGPSGAVLQIQIELADIVRSIAACAIVVIILVVGRHALPEGILIGQSHIKDACVIPVDQLAAAVFHDLLAILAGGVHITGNLGGRIACSAVLHVDVQRAFIYADSIEIMRMITVFSCRDGATANRYLGILASELDTAAAYTGDIDRTTDSHSGAVTGDQNTGSIVAIAAFSNTFDIADCQRAINMNLTLLALDINACCGITLRSNIRNFYCSGNIQMRISVSINTMRASSICIIGRNRKLFVNRRIDNRDISIRACVNRCCLSAGLLNTQSQSLTGHFDSHRARRGCRFTCIERAGKFIITCIRFSHRNMCYAAFIQLTTQADIFRLGNCACFIGGRILFRRIGIESLSCLLGTCISGGESDGFRSQAGRRCRQAFCDLDRSAKISICVTCIVEFSGQCVQRAADEVLLVCFG